MPSKSSKSCIGHSGDALVYATLGGIFLGVLGSAVVRAMNKSSSRSCKEESNRFSLADQPLRFKLGKDNKCQRMLNIESLFEPEKLKGKTVLVTGANRGLGLAIAKQLVACEAKLYATCRKTSKELDELDAVVIEEIDVTLSESMEKLVDAVPTHVDIVINNAGYFYGPVETLDSLNFEEELKMIDICALGSLRVTAALWNANKLRRDGSCKIIMITSQGGSIAWRKTQNAPGPDFAGNYGHHMSKAANNMMGKLVALELKNKAQVAVLHPGFNRTDMTAKYSHIWDIEGAVNSSVGAKRVLHEINQLTPKTSGCFINCEDGKEIPW
jgi:NAD(P)-dependent dehydrogenase (short-subunit alcohol dehydrogenase family)